MLAVLITRAALRGRNEYVGVADSKGDVEEPAGTHRKSRSQVQQCHSGYFQSVIHNMYY